MHLRADLKASKTVSQAGRSFLADSQRTGASTSWLSWPTRPEQPHAATSCAAAIIAATEAEGEALLQLVLRWRRATHRLTS